MEEGLKLIDIGIKYCKHVSGYATTVVLTPPILVNMAGMAAENLLGGLCKLYKVEAAHADVQSFITVLSLKTQVPDDVKTAARQLARITSVCGDDTLANTIDLADLNQKLQLLKDWVIAKKYKIAVLH